MISRAIGAAAVIAAVTILGCKKADDEFAPAVVPKSYTFEGKIDPKYAGTWTSQDGGSTMQMDKDGKLKIETETRSVAGKSVSNVSGDWLSNGDSLLMRYAVGTQQPTILKYLAALSGSTLTLQQEGGRVKTTYRRK